MNTVPAVIWGPAFGDEAAADLNAALTELYGLHYRPLVRLASMLVRETGTAEEVVQDAFVALYGNWSRLRDTGKAGRTCISPSSTAPDPCCGTGR